MSKIVEPYRVFQTLICLASIVPVGCAARGYERASATSLSIDVLKTELTAAKEQLDTSVNALDQVVSAEDASKPYEEFVYALAEMEGQADTIRAQTEALRAAGATYFDEWEAKLASFTNEDMRKLSETRRADLVSTYDEINAVSQKTKEAYEPLMADLNDIKKYLDLDLSAAGVGQIGAQVKKVKGEAAKVQESIDALVQVLDQLSSKLATGGAGGGAAPTSSDESESSDTESSDTESSDTESSDTESSDTESSDRESSNTPSSDTNEAASAADNN